MAAAPGQKNGAKAPLPFHWQFFAGAVAGVSETIVMYPLDVVKTRFQIQVGTGNNRQYSSIINCLTQIVSQEGFKALYRGIVAPVIVEAPKRAVKFSANEFYTKLYLKLSKKEKVDQPLSIATGMSTGATEAFVIVSFDLVKIRMQDKSNAGKYRNTIDCIQKIFKEEGFGAFFKGLGVTVLRHTAWNGGYFGVIYGVKSAIPKSETQKGEIINNLIAGTIGGSVGTILNTPFDVVKTRIQNQLFIVNGQAQQVKYKSILSSFSLIIREEGFAALYKGFIPKVLRLGPGGGVLLVVFDGVSELIRKYAQ